MSTLYEFSSTCCACQRDSFLPWISPQIKCISRKQCSFSFVSLAGVCVCVCVRGSGESKKNDKDPLKNKVFPTCALLCFNSLQETRLLIWNPCCVSRIFSAPKSPVTESPWKPQAQLAPFSLFSKQAALNAEQSTTGCPIPFSESDWCGWLPWLLHWLPTYLRDDLEN